MKLKKFKIDNRYTFKQLAVMFEVSARTVVYWVELDHDYKRENGNHVISRNQIVKTIPIKKGK